MAKQAELFDLQKTGRTFYETKKYADALDTFSKAVVLAQKWSPSDVPTILDQRVAVHVKLGNIDMARRDSMSMIRSNKADGRGYLRCGQLDRLEDNPSAALRWYEHGLKHVPGTDPLRSTLNAQRDKTKLLLEQKLMSSNSRNPVSTLPAELVQHILTYLDYIVIVKALRVSKAWKETFSRLKPLTDTVDFGDAQCAINCKMMVAVLKRLGPNPKKLMMKDLSEPAEVLLRKNLKRWNRYTQLEELTTSPRTLGANDLPFAKYNLRSLKIEHGTLQGPMVLHILKECRSLEVARFSRLRGWLSDAHQSIPDDLFFPTVRVLHLGSDRYIGGDGFLHYSLKIYPNFLASFPHLEELVCHNLRIGGGGLEFHLSGVVGLRKLFFSSCGISQWPTLPPSIEIWDNYDTDTHMRLRGTNAQPTRLGELANLKCLRFNKTSPPPPITSFMPEESTSSITTLDIRNTPTNTPFGTHYLAGFIAHLRHLREFAWGGTDKDQDITLPVLCRFEKLETLSLLASRIHGAELIALLRRTDNRLQQITLTDCENVSPDTIEWARNRGVAVHVKRSQTVSGSERRVRLQ